MIAFEVVREPRGTTYEELITFLRSISATFGLIQSAPEDHRRARELLATDLASTRLVKEWPGSRALDEHVVSTYEVTAHSVAVLLQLTHRLYGWSEFRLPADLHFRREDGTLVLGSCGSERFAWLELTNDEAARCPSVLMELLRRGS